MNLSEFIESKALPLAQKFRGRCKEFFEALTPKPVDG
jgi:hypothetical protein